MPHGHRMHWTTTPLASSSRRPLIPLVLTGTRLACMKRVAQLHMLYIVSRPLCLCTQLDLFQASLVPNFLDTYGYLPFPPFFRVDTRYRIFVKGP